MAVQQVVGLVITAFTANYTETTLTVDVISLGNLDQSAHLFLYDFIMQVRTATILNN